MDAIIRKSVIKGKVVAPVSKSVAHRLMIACALAGGRLDCPDGGKDMAATARCIDAASQYISAFLERKNPVNVGAVCMNVGESGSTLRFLLPILCAVGANVTIDGEGRLKDRPIGELINTLEKHGAMIERDRMRSLPLKTGGRLRAGEYRICGSVSSQYVTGLLFALPLLDGDSSIMIEGETVSANYIDITLDVLNAFGIEIDAAPNGYFVRGNQKYVIPHELSVEGDWSSAAFPLAMGLLCGEVRVGGLDFDSLQGDKVVVDLMKKAGADISVEDGDAVAKKSALCAIDFDAKHCPDAVPVMAALLSFANGISHISGVDRLRAKESDRLEAVMALLKGFGIKTHYADDVLTIYGGLHKPCIADGFCDHRIAMSAAIMALCTDGESKVLGVECIEKSYPAFIEDAKSLGAKITLSENL